MGDSTPPGIAVCREAREVEVDLDSHDMRECTDSESPSSPSRVSRLGEDSMLPGVWGGTEGSTAAGSAEVSLAAKSAKKSK